MARRYDKTGEPYDDQVDQQLSSHDPGCVDGWLPDDAHGRAVPCLDCRPHLARTRRRLDWLLGRGEWSPR
jgi:hypothetical protein